VDSARENNTVACLGSGSSKTFIAVMVIKEQAFKVRHSTGTEGVKTLFFVNSGMSLLQQRSAYSQWFVIQSKINI
jgi:endoribonuclease Dicer